MSGVSQPATTVGSLFSDVRTALPDEPRTFDYRPVPISAPVALFFGISGLLAFLAAVGVVIALVGLSLSAWSLLKIRRARGEYGGSWVAGSGLLFSAVSFVGGVGVHSVAYATEVPEGYTRLNFTEDISRQGLVFENGQIAAPPKVAALDGKQVFLKGFIFPSRQSEGLTSFVFCRDSGECCFGGAPKIEDMILVKMADELTTDYSPGLVSVAGTFKLRKDQSDALDTVSEIRQPIYEITAILAEPSRTSFQ